MHRSPLNIFRFVFCQDQSTQSSSEINEESLIQFRNVRRSLDQLVVKKGGAIFERLKRASSSFSSTNLERNSVTHLWLFRSGI